ncbi:hypothetical protein [Alkalicoccus saliphilus]|nr:hypothetical protein [Alkalicoccus saliphilus]
MLKFAVDARKKTSLPTGRLAVEEILSFLRGRCKELQATLNNNPEL